MRRHIKRVKDHAERQKLQEQNFINSHLQQLSVGNI